jgi:hypothetical protein
MKKVLKAFGVIAFIAVIAFSMAACDGDSGGGGGGINGTWRSNGTGLQVNINGSSGTIRAIGTLSSFPSSWQSAINNGYVSVGSTFWQNISSTGSSTWSARELTVVHRNGVATGTGYNDVTFSLSYDGQTLTVSGRDSGGNWSATWRKY